MKSKSDSPFQPGVLTVSLPRATAPERLDELAATLHQSLMADGIGRFLWHQQKRRYDELVFHIIGDRAAFHVRAELDRLGYDRLALVVSDFSVQPIFEPATPTN